MGASLGNNFGKRDPTWLDLRWGEGRVPVFRMAPWGWDATTLPDGHLLVRGPGEGLTSLT